MGTPYNNDKASTQVIKEYIKPHVTNKLIEKAPKPEKGPKEVNLPIRGR